MEIERIFEIAENAELQYLQDIEDSRKRPCGNCNANLKQKNIFIVSRSLNPEKLYNVYFAHFKKECIKNTIDLQGSQLDSEILYMRIISLGKKFTYILRPKSEKDQESNQHTILKVKDIFDYIEETRSRKLDIDLEYDKDEEVDYKELEFHVSQLIKSIYKNPTLPNLDINSKIMFIMVVQFVQSILILYLFL